MVKKRDARTVVSCGSGQTTRGCMQVCSGDRVRDHGTPVEDPGRSLRSSLLDSMLCRVRASTHLDADIAGLFVSKRRIWWPAVKVQTPWGAVAIK